VKISNPVLTLFIRTKDLIRSKDGSSKERGQVNSTAKQLEWPSNPSVMKMLIEKFSYLPAKMRGVCHVVTTTAFVWCGSKYSKKGRQS
jgi:hypothetical protein